MPVEYHSAFPAPEDIGVTIWRYMDFTKFAALLESRSLFFCRLDRLGDPFEGSWPRINVEHRREIFRESLIASGLDPSDAEANALGVQEVAPRIARALLRHGAVNCWHMGNHESAALWRMYSSTEGIAIRSTFRILHGVLNESATKIFLGTVRYLDFDKDVVDHTNAYTVLACKRRSFEFEAEVRAVVVDFGGDFDGQAWEHGLHVAVDLDGLIQAVHVSPTAPHWVADLVRSIVSRYGINVPVNQSALNGTPLF